MSNEIYQIKIVLVESKPKIWRRVLVEPNMSLSNFHSIIQTTMGWENSHLFQFIKNRNYYAAKMDDDDLWDDMGNIDIKNMKISDLLIGEKDKLIYEYDFGDSWGHKIVVEKIVEYDNKIEYPVCLTGKNSCPPEDCGGIWGYENMLEVLKDPKDEEYESTVEWVGDDFDPKCFDIEKVNELLKKDSFGSLGLFE